jgi:hypothetical protein
VELTLINPKGDTVLLHKGAADPARVEAMRLLPKGDYTLRLQAKGVPQIKELIVRTMPETHFVKYPAEPRFPELGVFDWAWLKAHVLSSVNTVVGDANEKTSPMVDEWTRSGRKFISYGSLPHDKDLTGPKAFEYWYKNPGFQDPRLSGLIADEFSGRQNPLYPAWIDGMRQLGDKMKGSGKAFYAYCGGPGMYSRPEARELVKTVFDSGFYMAWERYHHEAPSLAEANEMMDSMLGAEMKGWRGVFPDCQKKMVMVLGLFATGPDLDVQPDVNYKVLMDMQMQYLATRPEFDGLFGVHWWVSSLSSDELLLWESALYRHYCVEGAIDLLSKRYGWDYMLRHVKNPDFVDGTTGWTVDAAGPDTLKARYLERYARAENRYWNRGVEPDYPSGNAYLWTKRSADKPNKVTQEITNLASGRLYSAQLITADYNDIIAGKSDEKKHAVSLTVDGAEAVAKGSYLSKTVSSPWTHEQLPFKDGPAWFNHHRVLFRATRSTARITISDWATPTDAGGPVGQELMFNYVQVEPYFEEDKTP